MSVLAKTSIFAAGAAAGAMVAAAVTGSAAVGPQPSMTRPGVVTGPLGPASAANCAPGFSVTSVWGHPVASPTPSTPSYGWTCITPVVHCVGAPAWLSVQAVGPGNGFGRVSYKCSWIQL
jgi:hypothetical protein